MAVNILTFEDLQKFKMELLAELKGLINNSTPSTQKKWLKSYEVRQMLGISRGTLQNLNTNGSLPATRIGGLLFFNYDDIQKLMQGKKMIKR
jgi:excisionase family DNA binding protein